MCVCACADAAALLLLLLLLPLLQQMRKEWGKGWIGRHEWHQN